MRVRYTGPDPARLVPLPDGDTIEIDRMEWVDLDADHARSLNEQDDWELESVAKARRTRKATATEPAATEPEPAEPEQSDEPAAPAAEPEES